jgi:hypothetical protein
MVDYILIKANKSMLRGLAYAVSNGHLTDEECYEALPNKLNYEESMFFKDCTMDAIKEIASAELQKLATAAGVDVKDLDSPEATQSRIRGIKNSTTWKNSNLGKPMDMTTKANPAPRKRFTMASSFRPTTLMANRRLKLLKKVGFHIAFDGNTWACDPNGPSFTAMPPSEAKNTVVIQDPKTNTYYVISPNDHSAVTLPSLSDDNETHRELARMALEFHARQPPGIGVIRC